MPPEGRGQCVAQNRVLLLRFDHQTEAVVIHLTLKGKCCQWSFSDGSVCHFSLSLYGIGE